MTRDEIRKLAEQAGDDWENTLREDQEFLIRFASLVEERAAIVAAEKDKKIQELEDMILELQERME